MSEFLVLPLPYCQGCGHRLVANKTVQVLEELQISPCDVVMEKSWQNPNRPATQICPYFVCSSRYCRRMNSSHNVSISTASISTFFV